LSIVAGETISFATASTGIVPTGARRRSRAREKARVTGEAPTTPIGLIHVRVVKQAPDGG